MCDTVYNFSPGPSTLPRKVVEEASRDLCVLPGEHVSVLEISHRSAGFTQVIEEARANIRKLLELPDDYHVLFLQGGASLQFSMVPMNFLKVSPAAADYIVTGSWGKKAVKEAKKEGQVHIAWDGADTNYTKLPDVSQLSLNSNAAYVHFTSNETIEGVQFPNIPDVGDVPLVCDASSDILSRPLPLDKFSLIYAGAQKNLGPAGATLVLIREDMLSKVPQGLPSLLDYRLVAEKKSLLNTPPVFPIYMIMLVTRLLLQEVGSLPEMERINRKKGDVLYAALDASEGFYQGHAARECRSLMNVTWRLPSEKLEKKFLDEATSHGLLALKGHRALGGIRASIYNAMPVAGVETLASFMNDFSRSNA